MIVLHSETEEHTILSLCHMLSFQLAAIMC